MTASSALLVLGGIVVLTIFYVLLPLMLDAYGRFRGKRLVTCPETHHPAAVDLDLKRVALTVATGKGPLRLRQCSRWPERHDCGQECLRQIEAAPQECLIRTIVSRWYEGKACALCGVPLEGVQEWGHGLGLLAPDGMTIEWREVPGERLPEVLQSHRPICWNCQVAESFRRNYPDLVIDRPEGISRDRLHRDAAGH